MTLVEKALPTPLDRLPPVAGYGLLIALGRRLLCGRVTLVLPDGTRHLFEGAEPGPSVELSVRRPRFVRRLLLGGANGFAEAYLDADVDCDDLRGFLLIGARNKDAWSAVLRGKPLFRAAARLAHRLRPNTRRGARRNIAAHYDLGNDFYRLWLDPGMTYSSAVFTPATASLTAAQDEKYRRIAALAGIEPGDRVLEIGCGWGGFAEYAARALDARVTAITVSRAQHDFARQRIAAAGLDERVEIRHQDYRDVEERYDRIVSIEMLEAVGEAYWPAFFRQLRRSLAPGGRAGLQVITIADRFYDSYRRGADFIQRHVFPGGMLPSPSVLRREIEAAGLALGEHHDYGADYARTLAAWRERFDTAWPEIAGQGFDERFRRLWAYYLAYCEAGFRTGRIDVRQLAVSAG